MTEPNTERRTWLSDHLRHAAGALGATPAGVVVFGWRDRGIGARVSTVEGRRWLRVVAARDPPESVAPSGPATRKACGVTGVTGVPKPWLLTELNWSDGDYQIRAELMTLAPAEHGVAMDWGRVPGQCQHQYVVGLGLGLGPGWPVLDHLPTTKSARPSPTFSRIRFSPTRR